MIAANCLGLLGSSCVWRGRPGRTSAAAREDPGFLKVAQAAETLLKNVIDLAYSEASPSAGLWQHNFNQPD
jgi:hypothetical protein